MALPDAVCSGAAIERVNAISAHRERPIRAGVHAIRFPKARLLVFEMDIVIDEEFPYYFQFSLNRRLDYVTVLLLRQMLTRQVHELSQ